MGYYWILKEGFVKWYNLIWDFDDVVGTKDTSYVRAIFEEAIFD